MGSSKLAVAKIEA
jgi:MFS superfamily sulfate permease-like transporter